MLTQLKLQAEKLIKKNHISSYPSSELLRFELLI